MSDIADEVKLDRTPAAVFAEFVRFFSAFVLLSKLHPLEGSHSRQPIFKG